MSALQVGDIEPTLDQLAATANTEHEAALAAGHAMLLHALAAGEALLAIKSQLRYGEWSAWQDGNLRLSRQDVQLYCRLATHRQVVLDSGVQNRAAAEHLLRFLPMTEKPGNELREEARRLIEQGSTQRQAAALLGVSHSMVAHAVNPALYARKLAYMRERSRRRAEERRALQQAQRQEAIKKALVKAGEATNEAHRLAIRLNDVLAINDAHAHRDKMMDALVRALGVS